MRGCESGRCTPVSFAVAPAVAVAGGFLLRKPFGGGFVRATRSLGGAASSSVRCRCYEPATPERWGVRVRLEATSDRRYVGVDEALGALVLIDTE